MFADTKPQGYTITHDAPFKVNPVPSNKQPNGQTHEPNGQTIGQKHEPKGHADGRFQLLSFSDLKPGSTPNYLIKGVLPRIGLATVWGPPKCGKSFWMCDVALHIALGWKYRGKHTMQGTVVYCAFEGASGFHARAEAFRTEHVEELSERKADVPFCLMPTRLDLVRDHEALIASIEEKVGPGNNPGVVVLDTLNRSLNGSESKDVDMAAYINAADAMRERFNCLVVIIHHCGVDGTRPRGHTSLTGAIDAQLAVKRDNAKQIVTTVEHMKDGAEGEILVSTLAVVELGVDEDGDKITSCVIRPSDKPPGGSNGPRLSDQTAIALNLLRRAIEDSGEKPLRAIIFLWAPGLSGKPFGGSTIITGPDRGRTRNQTKEPDRRHLSEPSKSSRISSR